MKRKGFLNYYNQWPKEGSLFEQQYKDAPESDNPTVLLYLAHAYVSPKPMPQLAPSQASDNTSTGHVKSNLSKPGPSNNTKAALAKPVKMMVRTDHLTLLRHHMSITWTVIAIR
jgi:hypothetical protein